MSSLEAAAAAVVAEEAAVEEETVVAEEAAVEEETVVEEESVASKEAIVAEEEESVVEEEEESSDEEINDTLYIKDNVDYTNLVNKFLLNEESYYPYIHSFASNPSTVLRIVDKNGVRISSGVLLKNDIGIVEVKRSDTENFEREVHDSILIWFINVCGENTPINELFDRILIGKDHVPLWNILKVVDDENMSNTDSKNTDNCEFISIIVYLFVLFSIILYSIE